MSETAPIILRDSMFEPLLEADPSFLSTWNEFLKEWSGEVPPLYLALGDLARHLTANLAAGSTDRFLAIFEVVEGWHLRGEHFVREAATVGLLEDLQNENLHTTTKPADFVPWLGPESKKCWVRVEAFWAGDTNALREET